MFDCLGSLVVCGFVILMVGFAVLLVILLRVFACVCFVCCLLIFEAVNLVLNGCLIVWFMLLLLCAV